jgi:hypothetical protein
MTSKQLFTSSILFLLFAVGFSAQGQTLTVVSGSPQNPATTNSFALTLSDPTGNFNVSCDPYGCYNNYTTTITQGSSPYVTTYYNSAGVAPSTPFNTIASNMNEVTTPPNNSTFDVTVSDSWTGGTWSCSNCFVTSNLQVSIGASGSCAGSNLTAQITGGSSGYHNYEWSNTETSQTITNVSAGTYTVTVTDNLGVEVTSSSVTINSLDDASFSYSAASYCADAVDPIPTISGLGGGTFSSSAGLSINASTGAVDVSASTPGTYTITYTTAGACPNSSNVSITVNSLDDASFSYGSASYCVDAVDPIPTITGLGGGTFSASPAGLSINASTGAVDVSASIPGTYTITYTTAGACSNSSNVSLTVYNLTAATSSTDDSGAGDGTATATPSGGSGSYTYSWNTTPVQTTATATGLAAGSYEVTVTDANSGCTTTESVVVNGPSVPANDLCADAITVVCGETVGGTNVDATNDANIDFCNTSLTAGPGVWYTFAGTGDDVSVTTCNPATDFDTKLGVFSGDCNALVCVGGNDDDANTDPACALNGLNRKSTVNFTSEVGVDYYFYVVGFGATDEGIFDLTVTCTPPQPAPANDLCADAISLACGDVVSGNTDLASADASLSTCGTSLSSAPGLWYAYTGTGEDVTVSTCSPNTTLDTKLGVFSGDCNTLVCVDGNDDDSNCGSSGLQSTVEFYGEPGVEYYIYVTAFSTNTGDFELSLSCTCTADAGTLTAGTSPVCLVGGSAVVSATENVAPNVPVGYSVLYVLTEGAGLVIVDAGLTPSFTVTAAGDYTIHTLVYDPLTLDPGALPPGATGFDVNGLLIQGGGSICGALDVAGAAITVDVCTGINESLSSNLSVYPNPSNGQFVVEVNGVEGDAQIVVMDVAGRQVYNEGVTLNNSFRKDLNLNVAKGTYLLQIVTVEGMVTRKIQVR